mmetsp:Transcript_29906/g.64453  ORF Transcript_29906/g.64453 Transcript_29906/m.64453 type:complete len:638 (-) Transcript_29906:201-2114(-)
MCWSCERCDYLCRECDVSLFSGLAQLFLFTAPCLVHLEIFYPSINIASTIKMPLDPRSSWRAVRSSSIFERSKMTFGSLQNMGVSSSQEAYFVFAVGLLLSLNSGYINGLCISGLLTEGGSRKQGVSAFTGTYTKSGLALANGEVKLFRFEFTLILSFIGGAMAAGMMNPKAIPHKLIPSYGPTFLIGSLCMIAASISAALHPDGKALYYFAAMACGVQNGMTSTYSANLIRTTHLTGTSTDIGLIMGQMIRGNWKNYWKFKVLVGLAASFWLGSLISFYSASAFLSNSLWFSAALYLAIGLSHVTFVVLTQNVSFVQAFVGTWHWDRALQRMATSINVCEGSTELVTLTPAQIDNAFDQIDTDRSGEIDTDELKEALEKMGIKLTKRNVVTMINVVDENGDGNIDREEFHLLVNMTTMRAKHKQESKKKRSTIVNYAKSHIPKPSFRMDDASSSSNMKSSDKEGEEGEDHDHSVGIQQRHLPRTYQEALPSGKGDDRAIIITETKPPFTIVGVNEPWEDLCGYKSSEVVNKSMSGLIQGPKTNNMGLKHAIDKLSKGADQVECTTVNYRKDGSMFTNLLTMGPMYNEDEEDEEMGRREAAYYVGMLTNVGERAQDMSHMDEPEEKDDGGNTEDITV